MKTHQEYATFFIRSYTTFELNSLDVTQLASVSAAGISTESYAYDTEGRVSAKTLTLTSRPSHPFATDYIYDSLDRVSNVLYPAEYVVSLFGITLSRQIEEQRLSCSEVKKRDCAP